MPKPPTRKQGNPFYVLLVIAGTVFLVTAFAYGWMLFQETRPAEDGATPFAEHPLFVIMQRYGNAALLIELTLLAALTFAAMATDEYWPRRRITLPSHKDTLP